MRAGGPFGEVDPIGFPMDPGACPAVSVRGLPLRDGRRRRRAAATRHTASSIFHEAHFLLESIVGTGCPGSMDEEVNPGPDAAIRSGGLAVSRFGRRIL